MEQTPYKDFTSRFKLLISKHPDLITTTLSNIFTMRLIDIKIINEITKAELPVSLKAYGDGPLQLSTDKHSRMFPRLERESKDVHGKDTIQKVFQDPAFAEFRNINVLPLIYDEKKQRCNILVFDYERAMSHTARIAREDAG